MSKPIPFHDFGGKGKLILFAHANGYPPEAYQKFIEPFLKDFRVLAIKHRPLWGGEDPDTVSDWHTFAEDMIRFLEERGLQHIIVMGHSMGGTIATIVADKRPDLIARLILVDPVIIARKYSWWTKLLPRSIKKKIIPPAKISMKRRNHWKSKEEVYQLWRTKKVFKRFSDEVLNQFIEHAIVADGNGGMTLAFSREWETQVYITSPYVYQKLKKLKIPIIAIKGEKTNVISPEIWSNWQAAQPQNHFIEIENAGHLVPLECPEELAIQILNIL